MKLTSLNLALVLAIITSTSAYARVAMIPTEPPSEPFPTLDNCTIVLIHGSYGGGLDHKTVQKINEALAQSRHHCLYCWW